MKHSLAELMSSVHEERLTHEQLEQLHSDLLLFRADLALNLATLKKQKALFLVQSEEKTSAKKNELWDASPSGQELIQRKSEYDALSDLVSSVKSRIFSQL